MWNRAELKSKAKADLKGKWWKAFLAVIIFGIFVNGFTVCMSMNMGQVLSLLNPMFLNHDANVVGSAAMVAMASGTKYIFIIFAWIMLIVAPLEIGIVYYFVNNMRNKAVYNNIFMPFSKSYINIMLI